MMNLENMIVGSQLSNEKNKIKKIFFYRVCGTGMGACACLAKEAGFEVAGADMTFSPPMSTYLESVDIPLMKLDEVTAEILKEYDLIVVGNSVPRKSEFARFIEECGVPFTSFPSFLGEFILKDKEVIGLCGTHGKTTTTYFITQMLEDLGEDTGYFIGGIIDGRAPSRFGKSKYFVIESDEYDSAYFQKISKFRLYELDHMILTSLEFDHADIFNSIEDIKNEFASVIPNLSGKIIANDDYQAILDLKNTYPDKPWSFYGTKTDDGPGNIETIDGTTHFNLKLGNSFVNFETNIVGTHNTLNISSCIKVLHELGFNTVELQNSVKKLGMVKRRQEERGYYKKALVIDDFAHHPKAITLTVDAIKTKYPNKKIITVFEPISATARSSIFQEEFKQSLTSSDKVIIAANPLSTTVEDSENLNTELMVKELNDLNVESRRVDSLDSLITSLDEWSNENSLLLILSNRTCLGLWESDFVKNLS
jgi:UDP-N-acetylmuramate: L-alanyl-gamma-D-glutamyl-meso-diaminopimelate ligase